jgi:hypothetical protein
MLMAHKILTGRRASGQERFSTDAKSPVPSSRAYWYGFLLGQLRSVVMPFTENV